MTLQSSPPISLGDVANELGIALPLSLGDSRVLSLAGKSGPPISLSDLLGKSSHFSTNVNVTSSQQNYSYSGGGTIGYFWVEGVAARNPQTGQEEMSESIQLVDGGALSHLVSITYNGASHSGPFTNNQQVEIFVSAFGGTIPGNVSITLNF